MNNKAQTGIATYLGIVFVFVIIWAFGLGAFISYWGAQAVSVNSLSGIEAFFFSNLNLVIFFALIISSAGVLVWSSGAE